MAIEDFEWQGELTQPSQARLAQSESESATRDGWLARLRHSVWLEPTLRLGGMALLLTVLAGIGVVATTYAKPGLALPDGPRNLAAVLGTSWLKPTPADTPAPRPVTSLPELLIAAAPSGASSAAAPNGSAAPPVAEPPGENKPAGITPEGKVVLNVASADELTKLPGVGMKRALAIVQLRTKLKRFKHPSDLLRVKGIGPRGLQRMLPHLVLDA
ncbi:MAG TPA: helix-hairpin-helix domain-containing protein [Polyangiaceae bacterium]|nr:helix-hairpin-helix domain-containing protein [Polyangiaceae bacterium]